MTPVQVLSATDVLALLAAAYFLYALTTRNAAKTTRRPDTTTDIHVARLLCYPIKGCRGVDLTEAKIGEAGLEVRPVRCPSGSRLFVSVV